MKKDEVLKQQAQAIKQIREDLLRMLKAHFAKALGRSRSRATCWEHPVNPQAMDEEARLIFAQLIASHFWNLGDLEEYLDKVGWEFTNGEWEEAELYLKRDDLPWNVPRVGIADFVGREEKLAELKQVLLAKEATAPLIILVEGMPGVGKTMLVARLLAEREVRARFRDKIVWVSMEPGLIGDQVDDLEKRAFYRLVEQVFPDQRLDDRYYSWRETSRRKVRDALKEKRTLLILDGVVEPINLDEWRMMDQIVGRLLVTTQRQDLKSTIWTGRVKNISVGVLGSEKSRELLTRGNVEVDIGETDLNWLLEILDGLPLVFEEDFCAG
jgi:nucleoside-triphosphatase THEP1